MIKKTDVPGYAENLALSKKAFEANPPKKLEITMVPIGSLTLWKDNPRINDDAATKLAVIIAKHGIRSPIVAWDKNNVIYKGNTTFKACKILKMKVVPVIFHSFPSEVAAQAYGVADNKASEMAGWDEELLMSMMSTKEFKKSASTAELGFTSKEIELMDFWPPNKEHVAQAKKEGKEIYFTLKVKVRMDDFALAKKKLEEFVKQFEGATTQS